MIKKLSQTDTVSDLTQQYISQLKNTAFSGDIDISFATRIVTSTDNSIYQELPQAVIFPKSASDIQISSELANKNEFKKLTFGPRGGGTGTNGQSLTPGIVLDLSRHMRNILEINVEESWVKVETGVIKDQLNDFLKPYGFFFAPDLSTSNRATIGGMINTDASGQGSLVYGKTSDHVLSLDAVLIDGTQFSTQKMSLKNAKKIAEKDDTVGRLYNTVLNIGIDNRALILEKFPRLNRFLTGYDLENILNNELSEFDLGRVLTGSEGSLAVITHAKLNITPIANFKTLINIKYDSFDSALRNSPFLVQANATSVETVDSKVLNLAREDIIWHSVSNLITDVPGKNMQGLNMVEFNGETQEEIDSKVKSLCSRLDELIQNQQAGLIGYQLLTDKDDILKIYAMRKKSVGLLGKTASNKKPLAFAEDTAVPPEFLADYIQEFRTLLDGYELDYGMFGHVDAGVLHVRPALDMCDPEQEKLLRIISDEVVKLTAKYGGLMWGEHGKGYRSEYGPDFFGEELFLKLREIKTAFDPLNKLNPGKICTPTTNDFELVSVDSQKRSWFDKEIPINIKTSFENAMNCNGNGLCFNYDEKSPMCPSYKVTGDRRYSPKGRASLMREWLRLQTKSGTDLIKTEQQINAKSTTISNIKTWFGKLNNTKEKSNGIYDFSHEVKESMEECLACKACTTACPINVDVPTFRSRFLNYYHGVYARPLKDYFVANIEKTAPLMSKLSLVINPILKMKLTKEIIKNHIGYIDTPLLSQPSLAKQVRSNYEFNFEALNNLNEVEKSKTVLIVQDPFTSFYEAELVVSLITLVEKLNLRPILLPFKPNGKPQHVKGFLKSFSATAKNSAQFLNQVSKLNIKMIGLDASLVMCYRDEYNSILKSERGDFEVLLAHEWLEHQKFPLVKNTNDKNFVLINHCTETTALPNTVNVWKNIFKQSDLDLKSVSTGCCGMAGTYGHEAKNINNSKALYDMSWKPVIENNQRHIILATGFSCRSQVKRFENFKPRHPIELLAEIL
ncbi:D-2-hydroxyglutarate dehydrogenase YdiJ [Pseudoalteromonas denitrificans]|uniref:D-2-hydroxyglutarate dehydrogenase n=1 Tax=Pseudoalteromonas denitrificans DSM 6059 TaxID=1123010 RepID=A0A1I1GPR7_9GAMM|nr:FAD-binding and (Fe-S)-binding domain-containing protein [Pseudoalteromonas denitrificans]SFC13501.1 FAD/FMN-containing dehydrogenase [Pseudoalteromonas denitrificans DSM 6059]